MDPTTEQQPIQKSGVRQLERNEVKADNEWTVITHKSTKSSRRRKHVSANLLAHARPTEIVQGLNATKLVQDFNMILTKWRTSKCAVSMQQMLESQAWHVEGAVCIGIGSFSLDWENRHRALWQLALFVDITNWISIGVKGKSVAIYAQDPIFTPLDIEFLSMLEHPIQTLDSTIHQHITPHTFVFAPFVDWALLLPVFLDDTDPLLYIGNEVLADYRAFAVDSSKERKCADIGKRFLEKRETHKVPDFEMHGSALQGLVVHWKTDGDNSTCAKVENLSIGFAQLVMHGE
ncbi:hypothetical protein B0J11DRAFT_538473 [Dendryphion nanum]|uniref:SRR1-like domain-containing protein n=1 Tax=Dendryphion nanum TaxID=256645 RepID=A0A9P9DAP8_9PLEO|nr:hypothetical protein B0J11DRAFT_538473 [Dendryphion nanum]